MTVDLAVVGRTAAELMDHLAIELDDDASIDAVLLVVAVRDPETATIRYRCSDVRQWVQRALLREALELADLPDPDDERGDDPA